MVIFWDYMPNLLDTKGGSEREGLNAGIRLIVQKSAEKSIKLLYSVKSG